jgi:predicted N-formylglutamate amidohydrolase
MVEIRNDVIADAASQHDWAERLANILNATQHAWLESNDYAAV